jgi:hypothetical protein
VLAVNITELPVQKLVEALLIVATGAVFIVIFVPLSDPITMGEEDTTLIL